MPFSLHRPLSLIVAGLLVVGAAGCAAMKHQMKGAPAGSQEVARAVAEIRGEGGITGTVTFIEFENADGRAVRVMADVQGDPGVLAPGKHGFHIHQTGACEPSFKAAGGHFDPGPHAAHGQDNHPWHLGDLPNLEVDAKGHGTLDAVTMGFTVSPGPRTLFDQDGSAVMIHKQPDEWNPTAAGGDRLACGVIRKP